MTDWIDEAEAACEAAAQGPWSSQAVEDMMLNGLPEYILKEKPIQPDAEFIALSRTALPRALKALRAADELARILGVLDEGRNLGPGRPGIQKALAAYRKARS